MTQSTEAVAGRVRKLRDERSPQLSAAGLSARCAEQGVDLPRDVIANIENGRRSHVTVDELLALALALDTSPMALLVPFDDPSAEVAITPTVSADVPGAAAWLRGDEPLPAQDGAIFAETTQFLAAERLCREAAGVASDVHSEVQHAEYVGDTAKITDARNRYYEALRTLADRGGRLRRLGYEPGFADWLVEDLRAAGLEGDDGQR